MCNEKANSKKYDNYYYPPSNNEILAHNTAFVDIQFGANKTAALNNASKPFRNVKAAIRAVLNKNPTATNPWRIVLSVGKYFHKNDVIVPNGISIEGVYNMTRISSLVLEGTSNLINIIVESHNKTTITRRRGTATYLNTKFESYWDEPNALFAGPTVLVLGGNVTADNHVSIMTTNSVNGDIEMVRFVNGSADVTNNTHILNVNGNARNIMVYNVMPSVVNNLKISNSKTIINHTGSALNTSIMSIDSVPNMVHSNFNYHEINAPNSNASNQIIMATGQSTVSMPNNIVKLGNTRLGRTKLARGVGAAGIMPTVLFLNSAFSDTPFLGVEGMIVPKIYGTDMSGNNQMTGSMNSNNQIIPTQNNTVQSFDSALQVVLDNSTLVLPLTTTLTGQLVMINNNSSTNTNLQINNSTIPNTTVVIPPGISVIYQSINNNWIKINR